MVLFARAAAFRSIGFAVLFGVSILAGRMTIVGHAELSMIWPAAGVAVLWLSGQTDIRRRRVDFALLAAVTAAANFVAGAGPRMIAVFVVVNLSQTWLYVRIHSYLRPAVTANSSTLRLDSLSDMWAFLAAGSAGTALGVVLGTGGIWLITDSYSPALAIFWFVRNMASIVIVGAAGIRLGRTYHSVRQAADTDAARKLLGSALAHVRSARTVELVLLAAGSTIAYWLVFATNPGLPIAFTLVTLTIWAGLRAPTGFVVAHNVMLAAFAVAFTIHGHGVFGSVSSPFSRALIAQFFVGMVTLVGLILALGRDERVSLVGQLTVDKTLLAEQKEDASRQAELLRAIIDSMSDGLVVVDANAAVVLRNASAGLLLGSDIEQGGTVFGPAHYGLFHPDGTPVASHESVFARVIAGEAFLKLDLIVRNRDVPEGRVLAVTATRLLDMNGQPRAVIVAHDVTADRRHRDELTNFAGVIAHDLRSPLTAVDGWTKAATEALHAMPTHPGAADALESLTRAQRSADRMRTLISDLLSYTTARHAGMQPEDVDLEQLVTDIAAVQADSAVAAGKDVPRFNIGALAAVYADVTLVRQLMNNLIGNAIKYTAAGTVPVLDITTVRSEDGQVNVTLRDNGIGIPPGQHGAIFDNFHRAHPRQGVVGNGLGLGICKKIVERHGGAIVAEDNPGGGSVFSFTLPPGNGPKPRTRSITPVQLQSTRATES